MPTKNYQKIRHAGAGDANAVQRISADAYIPAYTAVLGTIPKPATENYRPLIERGEVNLNGEQSVSPIQAAC
jgi:hypothetical protein